MPISTHQHALLYHTAPIRLTSLQSSGSQSWDWWGRKSLPSLPHKEHAQSCSCRLHINDLLQCPDLNVWSPADWVRVAPSLCHLIIIILLQCVWEKSALAFHLKFKQLKEKSAKWKNLFRAHAKGKRETKRSFPEGMFTANEKACKDIWIRNGKWIVYFITFFFSRRDIRICYDFFFLSGKSFDIYGWTKKTHTWHEI